MRKVLILCLFLLAPVVGLAAEYPLAPQLTLLLPEVEAPWQVTTAPSEAFLAHLVEHVREEAAKKGRQLSAVQARQIALKRAQNNQLFVRNGQSGAHLLISFAPLQAGEKPPSARAISRSAEYAVESVQEEGWQASRVDHAVTAIKGARSARWFAIDYQHEGQSGKFMGVVGFANPYWFWFYANVHDRKPADEQFLERLMLAIEVRVQQTPGN